MFSLYPVPLQSDFYKNNVTFCHIVNLINTAKNYKIFLVFGSERHHANTPKPELEIPCLSGQFISYHTKYTKGREWT